MSNTLLSVQNLCANASDKEILHTINLELEKGKTHVLMGPNGAGKSTLGHVIMGNPNYEVTSGSLVFEGTDITEMSCDKRSLEGIFMSFQTPVEIPGVPLFSFLRSIAQKRPELKMSSRKFRKHVLELAEKLNLNPDYLERDLNVGFSGGEKKKIEMLQLLLLQPKLAILDETDSGLDVDALSVVSQTIETFRSTTDGTLLIITHNTRILERVNVDSTHVMVKGNMVAHGDSSLIDQIDANGFEQFSVSAHDSSSELV